MYSKKATILKLIPTPKISGKQAIHLHYHRLFIGSNIHMLFFALPYAIRLHYHMLFICITICYSLALPLPQVGKEELSSYRKRQASSKTQDRKQLKHLGDRQTMQQLKECERQHQGMKSMYESNHRQVHNYIVIEVQTSPTKY